MAQYIIAYIGGRQPATPEEGLQQKQKWGAWLQGLGDAVVNPGTPLRNSRRVGMDGAVREDGTVLTGYTVVEAASLDAALEMAKGCPFLEMGELEVAEMVQM